MKRLIRLSYYYYCQIGLYSCILIFVQSTPQERQYSRHVLCDADSRIAADCMRLEGHTRSHLECGARCAKDALSTGYSVNGTSCFNHYFCASVIGCTQENPDHVQYKKTGSPCCNDGDWQEALGSCKCYDGWIGQFCETRAAWCRELYDWGYAAFRIHIVHLDVAKSSQVFKVVCHRAQSSAYFMTYVFGNLGGDYTFNRTWEEYENGFFETTSHPIPSFFIGLKALHLLNRSLKELVVGAAFWDNNQQQVSQISIANQVLEDANIKNDKQSYEIDFKAVHLERFGSLWNSLTQLDCMTVSKKEKFSTWDNYQTSGDNQAVASGAGWWFSQAGNTCNYLGEWCKPDNAQSERCVSVDGIARNLFLYGLRYTRLFFRELVN